MEQTYQIKHRGNVICPDSVTVRHFLHRLTKQFPDIRQINLDILTIYDEPARKVITRPFATLRELYLSTQRLHICYHVPGAFLMTDQQTNNGITYSKAFEAIPDPMTIPMEIGGKYIYPTVSGCCTLGNFVTFLQKRGFLPEGITTMTVHECFCWESIPGASFDLTPGSRDWNTRLSKLNLWSGPPIFCTFE